MEKFKKKIDKKTNTEVKKDKKSTSEVKKDKKKSTRKLKPSSIILIVGLVAIMIPFALFGYELISAQLNTGTPQNGDRYKNDLDPAITKELQDKVVEQIKTIENVDDVKISLKTASFRIYVDVKDDLATDAIKAMTVAVYEKISTVLPIETYFKGDGTKKMYDLELHTYNMATGEKIIYYILNKNSSGGTYYIRDYAQALNQQVADELRAQEERKKAEAEAAAEAERNGQKPEPEVTVE
ncbi:MAG: hypothetical protein WBO70_02340 [Erysipelotrichaceae bacterium]